MIATRISASTRASVPLKSSQASDIDLATLEKALSADWGRLRFEPALENTYERDTGSARDLRHLVCNMIGIAAFWLLSLDDASRMPEIGGLLNSLRAMITLAALGMASLILMFRKSLQARHRESATSLGSLLVAGYVVVVAHHVGDTDHLLRLSGILPIFLHNCISARLQFRYALAVNLLSYLALAVTLHGDDGQAVAVVNNLLLVCGAALLFGTVGNYLLELRERRSYLLQCLKTKRHEALLVDAELLRELAERDELTQLFNRRHFDARLASAWQAALQQRGGVIGLLQVDVDHFKAYNDRYGHPAGDRCLAQVAAALQAAAERAGGIAARVGGEEFALLLPGAGEAEVGAAAADVCASVLALALPHEDSCCAPHVTVSVGAASAQPAPGLPASALVGAADAALYVAKRQGRNGWASADAPLVESAASPVRPAGGDSIAPEAEEIGDERLLIDRLVALLASRFVWLRFPNDFETAFQEHDAPGRHRLLTWLAGAGMAMAIGYAWLCGRVVSDVAGLLLTRILVLAGACLAAMVVCRRLQVGWRLREGAVSAVVAILGLVVVWTEAQSSSPAVYAATLGVCLLPMFSSMVAAQPLRFSLMPSLLICVAVATLTAPAAAAQRPVWIYTLGVVCVATLDALVCGYLLDRSKRSAYLLDRLRVAQLAVLKRNTEHLRRLATVDPLTRLPNRRHFDSELERLSALCMASRQPLALLIVDIDHFKRYNDGYGHPAGDACLQRVGAALAQWARGVAQPAGASPPVPARLGGEEFSVLLPGSDATAALAIAQRLRMLLRDLRIEHHHSPVGRFLTVSVGAASMVLGSAADARLLLAAADAALYRAKGLGRDQVAA